MQKPLIKSTNSLNVPVKTNQQISMNKGDKVLRNLRIFSAIIAHVIAIAFPIYLIYQAAPGSSLFSWHPTLMSVAFAMLMVEAILMFNPESSPLFRASRKTKVTVHWIFQTSCVTLALVGFIIIVYNKYANNKSHFTSWHGLLGVITVSYVIIQACCGVFLLYPKFAKNWKLVQLKTYHATFGLLGFSFACMTLITALFSNWFTKNVTGFMWGLSLFCPIWLALVIMNQVTTAYLPKTRRQASL